jgi:alginate O-acetyltransferase complex protein AlgI
VHSAVELLRWLGLAASPATLQILLPLGISFYTFQAMGYAVDVYRGKLAPARDALDFALFVGFFPQLVAGPISRAHELLPQLATPRDFARDVDARAHLALFLLGFLKKACLADGIAGLVDPFFAAPRTTRAPAPGSGSRSYHVQIYCDFAGYTDMALATAGLLGYSLRRNFDFPYFARSVGEFWRRWHISLSSWMRDYIYFPLVGKRPTRARRMGALLFTLGLCGLWHGAGWRFVGFGLLHGTYLATEELWKDSRLRAARWRASGARSPGPA